MFLKMNCNESMMLMQRSLCEFVFLGVIVPGTTTMERKNDCSHNQL